MRLFTPKIHQSLDHTQRITWWKIFKRYKTYLLPYLPAIIFLGLLGMAVSGISAAMVWIIQLLIDQVFVSHQVHLFVQFCALYAGLIALEEGLGFLDSYLSTWVGERFLVRIQLDLYKHVLSLLPGILMDVKVGDLLMRLEGDTQSIESLSYSILLKVFDAVGSMIFYGTALLLLSWKLTLFAVAIAPYMWIVAWYFSRKFRSLSSMRRKASGAAQSQAEEALQSGELIKTFGREDYILKRYADVTWQRVRFRLRSSVLQSVYSSVLQVLLTVGVISVLWVGGQDIISGHMQLGQLIAFMGYIGALYSPLRSLSRTGGSVQTALVSADRLEQVWQKQDLIQDIPGAREITSCRGHLNFEGVSFAYPGAKQSLHNIQFKTHPGQITALVGASGAGKTTILRLLMRLYDPVQGSITLDGEDIRTYKVASLRQQIAYIPQDTFLLDDTVLENIRFGHLEATNEEIYEAAKAAYVDEFIDNLPEGWETRVGARGTQLSAGQRQRIVLARSFLRDAPILILDEATAHLDAQSEAFIQTAIQERAEKSTVIIIAHRLVTVQQADQILVLKQGEIIQRGTHAALVSHKGYYQQLWIQQGLSLDNAHTSALLPDNIPSRIPVTQNPC